MKVLLAFLFASVLPMVASGQDRDQRIADLERSLSEAKNSVAALQKVIEGLTSEVQALRQPVPTLPVATAALPSSPVPAADAADAYRERILRPDLGQDERASELSARPELFIQSRFSALPIPGALNRTRRRTFQSRVWKRDGRDEFQIRSAWGLKFNTTQHRQVRRSS